jgi:hypothetical protein
MPRTSKIVSIGTLLATSIAIAIAAACTAFDDAEIVPKAPVVIRSDGGRATCALAEFPAAPKVPDGPSLGPIVMALHGISFKNAIGTDQDGFCTCVNDGGPSCTPQQGGQVACDDDAGRDNVVPTVLKTLQDKGAGVPGLAALFDFETRVKKVDSGSDGVMITIKNYNGLPADPSVTVEVRPTSSFSPKIALRKDGTDKVQPQKIDDPQRLREFQSEGYVVDNTVYVTLQRAELPLDDEAVAYLRSARLSLPLSRQGDVWYVKDGELAGRWGRDAFLSTIDRIKIAKSDYTICEVRTGQADAGKDSGISETIGAGLRLGLPVVINEICRAADLAADTESDSKGTICSALSVAARFNASSATLMPEAVVPTVVDNCKITSYCEQK